MRAKLIFLFLLVQALVFAATECIACEELADMPQARIVATFGDVNNTLDIYAYYENLSADPTRQPIGNAIMIIELSNTTGLKELFKTYTDDEGKATLDFSTRAGGCITFKILYCPFCTPEAPSCGFEACMNYSGIETNATNASELLGAPDAIMPLVLNPVRYLPEAYQLNYCPPPERPLETAPALCLPLIIIFSLLGGALYLTGRNPLAAFNIGGARVGRHIRYQARGRGYALDLKQAAMYAYGAASEMKVATDKWGKPIKKEGRPVRRGEQAQARWFGYSQIKDIGDVVHGYSPEAAAAAAQRVGQVELAGGRRERRGIAEAFREARREARAGTVRVFGAREEGGGRAYGARGVLREWHTDLGLGLARAVTGLWDSTWLSTMTTGLFLEKGTFGALGDAISSSRRQIAAQNQANIELREEEFGKLAKDLGLMLREGTYTTDEQGRTVVQLEITLSDGTSTVAKIISPQLTADGQWSGAVEVAGPAGSVTRYQLANGSITGMEQVLNAGTPNAVSIRYLVNQTAEGATLAVAGVVTYDAQGRAQTGEVVRDSSGRIVSVGSMEISRDAAGNPIFTDTRAGAGPVSDAAKGVLDALLANDGKQLAGAEGVVAADPNSLISATTEKIKGSYEHVREFYNEGMGLVRVSESAGATGTYDVTILDQSYQPGDSGATTDSRVSGTVLHVVDGKYTGATLPDGTTRGVDAFETRTDSAGRITGTYVAGTNIQLNRAISLSLDAGNVGERVGSFTNISNAISGTSAALQRLDQTDSIAGLKQERPAVFEAFGEVQSERQRTAGHLEATLSAAGQEADVAHAGALLLGATNAGYVEANLPSQVERCRMEYEEAMRSGVPPANFSPRAGAYASAVTALTPLGVDTATPEGRSLIGYALSQGMPDLGIPPITEIQRAETAGITAAIGSSDPQVRANAESAFRRTQEADATALASVLTTRMEVSAATVMTQNAPSLLGTEPGSLESTVGAAMLGLGTQLTTLPPDAVHARVQAELAAANIPSEQRQQVPGIVDNLLPQARDVAADFTAATTAAATQAASNPAIYLAPVDEAYGRVFEEVRTQSAAPSEFSAQGPPGAAARTDFIIQANTFLASSLSPEANSDAAAAQFISNYSERCVSDPTDNPLRLGPHDMFRGMAVSGLPGQGSHDIDPARFAGASAAVTTVTAAADVYGAAPGMATVYTAAVDGMTHFNRATSLYQAGDTREAEKEDAAAQAAFRRAREKIDSYASEH